MQKSNGMNGFPNFVALLGRRPQAWAYVQGSHDYPLVRGSLRFYQTAFGVLVVTEIMGLPDPGDLCMAPVYALHIHEGGMCTGNSTDPYADVGTHYNPNGCPHPYHRGDLPPLFSAGGYAYSVCLTNRFDLDEIIGRAIIIHTRPDDFTTQPSGNAGRKMACGVIVG